MSYEKLIQIDEHRFVRYVDHMGDDSAIVQGARVSYGPGTKTVREDQGLINHLLRHGHTSPFEMVEVKLHISCTLFERGQIFRHRTASVNEESARYSEMQEKFWLPKPEDLRAQSASNKQGSEGSISEAAWAAQAIRNANNDSYGTYSFLLDAGVCREQARAVLPSALITQFYWKIDGNNLMRFLKLRDDDHAQHETRQIAKAIRVIATDLFPYMMEAFEEYVGGARLMPKSVLKSLAAMIRSDYPNSMTLEECVDALQHNIKDDTPRIKGRDLEELLKALDG